MTRNSVYYWAGAATAMVLIAAIPAAFCEAVWSGEWRWLFAMIPGILIWNWSKG